MKLVINGENQQVPDGLGLSQLLVHLGLTEGPVAVERNGEVVPRGEHASTQLYDGDRLEIVHFVGGG